MGCAASQCRLGQARGGQPAGMVSTAQGCVCWGQGLEVRWHLAVLTLAQSCLVPSIISGGRAASCATRWK